MRLSRKLFGIQKKLFIYMAGVAMVISLVICAAAVHVAKQNIYASMDNQYAYVNEKAFSYFTNKYDEIDKLTDSWILNDVVQSSLENHALTANEREGILRALSFLQSSEVDYYLYMDNKSELYSQKNLNISYERFRQSDIAGALNGYAKTCMYWGRDELFGGTESCLFLIRYVRHVERNYEPGILCLRMSPDFLGRILEKTDENCVQLLFDRRGRLCEIYNPQHYELSDGKLLWIRENIASGNTGMDGNGLLKASTDESTGFTMATYVPPGVVNSAVREIYTVMIVIYLIIFFAMLTLTGVISRKLTQPIKIINDYMVHFDDTRLTDYVDIHTNTELDTIGSSYNSMIDHVGELITTIRANEQELRVQEIHSLVNQLQPHFLYNTLDTIYMLARISHEETIMKMIYALSRYLRINLSKGADEIPVEKELEHVCAYMDIQNIRNSGLFEYRVDCEDGLKSLHICKLILQPLAENAIKHGFSRISEGGIIHIRIYRAGTEHRDILKIEFGNNGTPISEESLLRLNAMETAALEQVRKSSGDGEGGYGIMNIVLRLRLKYGDGVRFYYHLSQVPPGGACGLPSDSDCDGAAGGFGSETGAAGGFGSGTGAAGGFVNASVAAGDPWTVCTIEIPLDKLEKEAVAYEA